MMPLPLSVACTELFPIATEIILVQPCLADEGALTVVHLGDKHGEVHSPRDYRSTVQNLCRGRGGYLGRRGCVSRPPLTVTHEVVWPPPAGGGDLPPFRKVGDNIAPLPIMETFSTVSGYATTTEKKAGFHGTSCHG